MCNITKSLQTGRACKHYEYHHAPRASHTQLLTIEVRRHLPSQRLGLLRWADVFIVIFLQRFLLFRVPKGALRKTSLEIYSKKRTSILAILKSYEVVVAHKKVAPCVYVAHIDSLPLQLEQDARHPRRRSWVEGA